LANLLETEEAKYRALVGDPHVNPNLRTHYTVGKVLSVLKVSSCCPNSNLHSAAACADMLPAWHFTEPPADGLEGARLHLKVCMFPYQLTALKDKFTICSACTSTDAQYLYCCPARVIASRLRNSSQQ
jgi:hypothetical protein